MKQHLWGGSDLQWEQLGWQTRWGPLPASLWVKVDSSPSCGICQASRYKYMHEKTHWQQPTHFFFWKPKTESQNSSFLVANCRFYFVIYAFKYSDVLFMPTHKLWLNAVEDSAHMGKYYAGTLVYTVNVRETLSICSADSLDRCADVCLHAWDVFQSVY